MCKINKFFFMLGVLSYVLIGNLQSAPTYLDKEKLVFTFGGGFQVTGNASIQLLDYDSSSSYKSKGLSLIGNPADTDDAGSYIYVMNSNIVKPSSGVAVSINFNGIFMPTSVFTDASNLTAAGYSVDDSDTNVTFNSLVWEDLGISILSTEIDPVSPNFLVANDVKSHIGFYENGTAAKIRATEWSILNTQATFEAVPLLIGSNKAPVLLGGGNTISTIVYPQFEDSDGFVNTRLAIHTDVVPESITISGNITANVIVADDIEGEWVVGFRPADAINEYCEDFTIEYVTHNVLIYGTISHLDTVSQNMAYDAYIKIKYTPESESTQELDTDILGSGENIKETSTRTFQKKSSNTNTVVESFNHTHSTQLMITLPANAKYLDSSLEESYILNYTACLVNEMDEGILSFETISTSNDLNQLTILALPVSKNAYEDILDKFESSVQSQSSSVYNISNFYDDYLLENQTESYVSETFAFTVPFFTEDSISFKKSSKYAAISNYDDYLIFTSATTENDFDYTTLKVSTILADRLVSRNIVHFISDSETTEIASIYNSSSNIGVRVKTVDLNYDFHEPQLDVVEDQLITMHGDKNSVSTNLIFEDGLIIGNEEYFFIDESQGIKLNGESLGDDYGLSTSDDLFYTGDISATQNVIMYFKAGVSINYNIITITDNINQYANVGSSAGYSSVPTTNTMFSFEDISTLNKTGLPEDIAWNLFVFTTYAVSVTPNNEFKIEMSFHIDNPIDSTKINGDSCGVVTSEKAICSTNYLIFTEDNMLDDAYVYRNFNFTTLLTNVPATTFDYYFSKPDFAFSDDLTGEIINGYESFSTLIIAYPSKLE